MINIKELKELGLEEKKALRHMRLDWSGLKGDEVCKHLCLSSNFDEFMD